MAAPTEFNVNITKSVAGALKPTFGQTVKVHYVGKFTDGKIFDQSDEKDAPFSFVLGKGQVIKGWDAGIAQLGKGEEAILTCPPDYAYGKAGHPGAIPPNSTLIFTVKLIDFK